MRYAKHKNKNQNVLKTQYFPLLRVRRRATRGLAATLRLLRVHRSRAAISTCAYARKKRAKRDVKIVCIQRGVFPRCTQKIPWFGWYFWGVQCGNVIGQCETYLAQNIDGSFEAEGKGYTNLRCTVFTIIPYASCQHGYGVIFIIRCETPVVG